MTTLQIIQSVLGALAILIYLIWGRKFIVLKQVEKFEEVYRVFACSVKKTGLINQNIKFEYVAFKGNFCYTNNPIVPLFIYKLEIIERDDKNLTLLYKGGTYKLRIMDKKQILTIRCT